MPVRKPWRVVLCALAITLLLGAVTVGSPGVGPGGAVVESVIDLMRRKGAFDSVVTFADPNLEAAVRDTIGKPSGELYTRDVNGIKELWAGERRITSLQGIEKLTRLVTLDLACNSLKYIEPLLDLPCLDVVDLTFNASLDASEGSLARAVIDVLVERGCTVLYFEPPEVVATTTALIGPEGGSIILEDYPDAPEVEIPAGELNEEAFVTVDVLSHPTFPSANEAFHVVGHPIRITVLERNVGPQPFTPRSTGAGDKRGLNIVLKARCVLAEDQVLVMSRYSGGNHDVTNFVDVDEASSTGVIGDLWNGAIKVWYAFDETLLEIELYLVDLFTSTDTPISGVFWWDHLKSSSDKWTPVSKESQWQATPGTRGILLVVHGWNSSHKDFSECASHLSNSDKSQFGLQRGSWTVYSVDYPRFKSVDDLGEGLAGLIDTCVAAGEKIVIVAHSQGGLVSRSAIEQWSTPGRDIAGRVEKLITLGTPHRGIPEEYFLNAFKAWKAIDSVKNRFEKRQPLLAFLTYFLFPEAREFVDNFAPLGPDVMDLTGRTSFLSNLNLSSPVSTEYYQIVGTDPSKPSFQRSAIDKGLEFFASWTYGHSAPEHRPTDGVVPSWSAGFDLSDDQPLGGDIVWDRERAFNFPVRHISFHKMSEAMARLDRILASGVVSGRVVRVLSDGTEVGIGNVRIDIDCEETPMAVRTNADGTWTSRPGLFGAIMVTPKKNGMVFEPSQLTVHAPAAGVNFQGNAIPVPQMDIVSGRIVDEHGIGIEGVRVDAVKAPGGQGVKNTETASDGTWSMSIETGILVDVLPYKRGLEFEPNERRIQVPRQGANFVGKPLPPVRQATCGDHHTVALRVDGTAWAWGQNERGQLGDDTYTLCVNPTRVVNLESVEFVAAGAQHSLAVKTDGTVWAWGCNYAGELGDGVGTGTSPIPVQVVNLSGVRTVAAGDHFSLALKKDGTVWAWGRNEDGELGDGTRMRRYTPVKVQGLDGVVAIAAGAGYSLAVRDDGTVWAWGLNSYGQLGDGTTTNRLTPVRVGDIEDAITVVSGETHALALSGRLTIMAWGGNSYGQLGNGSFDGSTTPVLVSEIDDAIAIAAGGNHSMAVKADGTVWAWGQNDYGQLGWPGTNVATPNQVDGLQDIIGLGGGYKHSLAGTDDGELWTWGLNSSGQLGDGTTVNSTSPIPITPF